MTLESSKKWILPGEIPAEFKKIYKDFTQLERVLLFNRGLTNRESIDDFFNLSAASIPSHNLLYNTKEAAEKIKHAILEKQKIYIHGDFDVDGVSASAILWEFLYRELSKVIGEKIDVVPYIPDRVDEGYGLSEKSVSAMIEKGANLIVTVDCGIRDNQIIKKYIQPGELDIIVTDHHQPPDDFTVDNKDYDYTIVHQMHPKQPYPYDKICGATVSFLLVQALRQEFGLDSTITENTPGLDLVALATVTDMMPLVGINRSLVSLGLSQINKGGRLGLRTLCEKAKTVIGEIDSYHLGYIIGPRINAAGRMGSAMDALRLMIADTMESARLLADKLDDLNWQRQKLTETMIKDAKAQISSDSSAGGSDNKLIFVTGKDWQEGIVGLVAGKIMEEYGKPVISVSEREDEARGSARSVLNFNITDAIGRFSKYLEKYGGHSQAAGFTVKAGQLSAFKDAVIRYANEKISNEMIERSLNIDYVTQEDEPSLNQVEQLARFKPFGLGNRKPFILIKSALVMEKRVMGASKNHMKIVYKGNSLGLSEAIMFDCLEDIEKINTNDTLDLVGYIDSHEWNGSTDVQFMVKEWKRSDK